MQMKQAFDPSFPFKSFIKRIEDGMMVADAGNTPFTSNQLVKIAYTIMNKAQVFADECKDWRKKPVHEKSWANFKLIFGEAHQDQTNF